MTNLLHSPFFAEASNGRSYEGQDGAAVSAIRGGMGSGREGTTNIELPTLNIEVKRRRRGRTWRSNG
jgi:hypothetical protein